MKNYQIPERYLKGFQIIASQPPEAIQRMGALLKEMPIGGDLSEFMKAFQEETEPFLLLAETIFSLGGLLVEETDYEALSQSLTLAYIKQMGDGVVPEEKKRLEGNLKLLFDNAGNLKKTYKAFQLLTENQRNYMGSRVMTDIRLIFDEDIGAPTQTGVITHQLKLDYQDADESKQFFLSLNRNDLIELKNELERALEKEKHIKQDQKQIGFVEIK